MPIPHSTVPLSMRCFAARAFRLPNRSSPSSSFARTSPPSSSLCTLHPPHRLGADPPPPLDLPREVRGVRERGVDAPRPARSGELQEAVEVGVVGERELGVDAVAADEVEDRGPAAAVGQLPATLADPTDLLPHRAAHPG